MRLTRAALSTLLGIAATACHDSIAPVTGAIRLELTTSGVDIDPDGYLVRVDLGEIQPIAANGSLVITGLQPGRRVIHVTGWANNCRLQTSAQRSVEVLASDTVDAVFASICSANVGAIHVFPNVTGQDIDPDGFVVSLDGQPEVPLPTLGTFLQQVPVGSHTLTLSGLANNCSVQQATLNVVVVYGVSAQARHAISCAERLGRLQVKAITTGVDSDDRYDVDVEGFGSQELLANATITVNNVREGQRVVTLRDVNPNCTVTGVNPRPVSVEYAGTTLLTFEISCVAAAKVRVALSATGVDIDARYRVRVEGSSFDRSFDVDAGAATTIVGMGAGQHTVTVEDIAVNCDPAVSSTNPRVVMVASGATTDVAFDIACVAARHLSFVRWANGGPELLSAKSNGDAAVVLTSTHKEENDPAYSPDGSKIAFRSHRDDNYEIYVMNADGSGVLRLTNHAGHDLNPSWSPDGSKIAFRTNRDGNDEIYVMNADGSNAVRLTNHPSFDGAPAWSPDGSRIAFMSDRSGKSQIYVMNADGSNPMRLTQTLAWNGLPAWSPDGTKIAFTREVLCYDYYGYAFPCQNIFIMDADGSNVVQLESWSNDTEPAWSPDGEWIAFDSSYCDYYTCQINGISAMKPDGKRRVQMLNGQYANPTWRP